MLRMRAFFSLRTSRLFTFVIFYHVVSILLEHIQMEIFILCLFFIFTLFAQNIFQF